MQNCSWLQEYGVIACRVARVTFAPAVLVVRDAARETESAHERRYLKRSGYWVGGDSFGMEFTSNARDVGVAVSRGGSMDMST